MFQYIAVFAVAFVGVFLAALVSLQVFQLSKVHLGPNAPTRLRALWWWREVRFGLLSVLLTLAFALWALWPNAASAAVTVADRADPVTWTFLVVFVFVALVAWYGVVAYQDSKIFLGERAPAALRARWWWREVRLYVLGLALILGVVLLSIWDVGAAEPAPVSVDAERVPRVASVPAPAIDDNLPKLLQVIEAQQTLIERLNQRVSALEAPHIVAPAPVREWGA